MANMNVRAVITAEDRASSVISGVGTSFGKLTGAMALGQVAAQGIMTALSKVVDVGKEAVKQAASFEQTRIGLENMLGSADKARKLLSDISKFAAETPFEFPELAEATKQLVAFGFGAEDAFSTMKQLGDVSAAVGAPINDLAYLMGTLRTQGRAFTIDIRQFAQRGIPIYEYLAKVLKVNENELSKMIEAGKVGFPEVQKAFSLMTAEGGKFHGTMAKQSKSLNGLVSTMKDNFGQLLRNMVGITNEGDVIAGSVFDRLRNSVSQTINAMPLMVAKFQEFIGIIAGYGKGALENLKLALDFLKPSLDALWNVIQTQLMPSLVKLWNEVIKPLAPAIGVVLVGAIYLIVNALNLWFRYVSIMYNGMANLYTFITKTFPDGVRSAFDVIVAKFMWLKDNWTRVIGYVIMAAITLPIKLPAMMLTAVIGMIRAVANVNWGNVFSAIWRGALTIVTMIKDLWVNTWHFIKNINWGAVVVGFTKSMANGLVGLLEGAINGALSGIPGAPNVKLPRFANGVNNFSGGLAVVGERGPEVVSLPKASSVIPNNQIAGIGSNEQISINVNVGIYAGSEMEKRKLAMELLGAMKDVASSKNMTLGKMMG